jgi:hypothetical protein
MLFSNRSLILSLFGTLAVVMPLLAQPQQPAPGGSTNLPGREVLAEKCFQCHGDGMWKDHRQDRRGWEGVLYRMMGRGAVWTEEDVRVMADYLAATYGPASKPAE